MNLWGSRTVAAVQRSVTMFAYIVQYRTENCSGWFHKPHRQICELCVGVKQWSWSMFRPLLSRGGRSSIVLLITPRSTATTRHLISCDRARLSAHQYPVNILRTQVSDAAACKHNILFTEKKSDYLLPKRRNTNKIAGRNVRHDAVTCLRLSFVIFVLTVLFNFIHK